MSARSSSRSSHRRSAPRDSTAINTGSYLTKKISDWSRVDVLAWLDSISMSLWKALFWENHVTGAEIQSLTEEDLKSLGITKPADRKRILKEAQTAASAPAVASTTRGATAKPAALHVDMQKEWDKEAGSSEDQFNGTTSEDVVHGGETQRASSPTSHLHPLVSPTRPGVVVTIKLVNGDDIHAVRGSYDTKLSEVKQIIKDIWGVRMRIKFRDEDEDFITIRRQQDFADVMSGLAAIKSTRLRLTLMQKEPKSTSGIPVAGPGGFDQSFRLLDAVGAPCVVFDHRGLVKFINSEMKLLLGVVSSVGLPISQVFGPDVRFNEVGQLQPPSSAAEFLSQSVVFRKFDGTTGSSFMSVSEFVTGNEKHMIGTLSGTEPGSVWLEHARNQIDSLTMPGIAIDCSGHVIGWNSAATQLLGYSLPEIVGQNVKVIMTHLDRANHDFYLRRYQETGTQKLIGSSRKVVIQTKSGTLKPAFLSVSERYVDKEAYVIRYFIGTVQDATS